MKDVWVKKVGENRGRRRIYLDGLQALRAGFAPGERFDVEVDGQRIVISKNTDGSRVVSRKTRGERDYPVIDINSSELLSVFDGMDAVRVVVGEDRVFLLPLASEAKKVERLNRITQKMRSGEPLKAGSLTHGGGVLAHAIHAGLADAGVQCDMVFANEIRDDMLLQAIEHNELWGDSTAALALPMQELVQDDWLLQQLPKLDLIELGVPCSGVSIAGVTKGKLTKAEDHEEVGHLVYSTLVLISKTQPAVCLLECGTRYADTASAQILRHQFRDMGYDTHEAILSGKDFGCLEDRQRWCMVAVTRGVEFSFEDLAPRVHIVRQLADVIDRSIGLDDPRWRAVEYLKQKEARNAEAGHRFKMQFLTEASFESPVLRKGYAKGGSSDPRLQHPENPALSRLLTAREHAAVKGIPAELIEGLSESMAHQLLGQGIVYEPFRAAGQRIGQSLLAIIERDGGDLPSEALDEARSEVSRRRQRMTG